MKLFIALRFVYSASSRSWRARLGAKSRLIKDVGVGYRRKATNYRREPRNANWTDADKIEACGRP